MLLDNNYGKSSSFIAAWNTNWDGMQVCDELPMAVEAVRREIKARDDIAGHRGLFVSG